MAPRNASRSMSSRSAKSVDEEPKVTETLASTRSRRGAGIVGKVAAKAASQSVKARAVRMKKRAPSDDEEEKKSNPRKKAKKAKTEAPVTADDAEEDTSKSASKSDTKSATKSTSNSRDSVTPDPDPADIPDQNPDVVRHEGKWYWLLKAEPESRFEGGIDVRFSIDDLRARTKPEGWDGIRNYAARNNLRAMNAGDMAFFYHSNCKTPGIVGTMEIVKEYTEDKSARRPGTPYYDAQSTREKPRWSLVHVEFRRKFAVPILLPELREMGKGAGSPLESMQLIKQSRLSVSKVSEAEWEVLCALADEKAKEAGLEHEE